MVKIGIAGSTGNVGKQTLEIIDDLQKIIFEYSNYLAEFEKEASNLSEKITAEESKRETLKGELNTLQSQLEELTHRRDVLESEIASKQQDIEQLSNIILDKEKIQQGLEMIHSKFKNFLEKEGLKEIDTQGKFNPHFHEALFFEERQDLEEHTIIEVIQKGYLYEDKVLRTAKVKVSVKPKKEETEKKVETEKIEESNK